MSKWKCGICNSRFDNYQAQGFNGIIYCPLCYFKELYKREKTKNDKAIEIAKEKIKRYESYINDLKNGNYPSPIIRQERQELMFRIKEQEELLEILKGDNK